MITMDVEKARRLYDKILGLVEKTAKKEKLTYEEAITALGSALSFLLVNMYKECMKTVKDELKCRAFVLGTLMGADVSLKNTVVRGLEEVMENAASTGG